MNVGIVTVVYAEYPELLFESVRGNSEHAIRWYVHCHSTDATLENRLAAFCATDPVNLTLHRWNRGLAKSWNDGIIESYNDGSDITLVVNDDISFIEDGLDKFIEFISDYEQFGIAWLHGLESAGSPLAGQIVRQDFACFAIGPTAFASIGAFDENFFPAYFEDTDYILRCLHANIPVVTDRRVLVEHARNKTSRKSEEVRQKIAAIKLSNSAFFERKWGGIEGHTKFSKPFDSLPLKINWEKRRNPHGPDIDRPELLNLEAEKWKITSSTMSDSRIGQDHVTTAVPDRTRNELETATIIRVIYKALLHREPEEGAYQSYSGMLSSGTHSVDDLCTIIRSSSEYRRLQRTRASVAG